MRIGYRDADRQITYPSQHNLSTCIRISTPLPPTGTAATHPAGPRRQTSARPPAARPPCGARPTRPHTSCRPWLLCVPVGGGPPARSPHASSARSARSRGPPWPYHHPPAPQPLPPSRPRATLQSGGHPHHSGNPRRPRVPLPLAPPPAPATLTTAGNTPDEIGK